MNAVYITNKDIRVRRSFASEEGEGNLIANTRKTP